MRTIYRGLTYLAAPLLRLLLQRRLAEGKEDPDRIGERIGRIVQPRPDGSLLWIHGASIGELTAVLPLIELLTIQQLADTVLVTSGTVTSARLAAERLPPGAIHQFIPLDHPGWVSRFYDHWRPDAALWLESEFWPNLLAEARRRHVKMMLLNARVTEKSLSRWRLLPGLSRFMMDAFDHCLAPDDDQARRLKMLGAQSVQVVSNLKDVSPPLPFDAQEHEKLRDDLAGRTVWLAASTHLGEEDAVAHVHERLRGDLTNLLTIVVPRHPERGDQIGRDLDARGLTCARRSSGDTISEDTDIYIADTLGELGLLYRATDIVFVGGSLVPHGGQNLAEAARLDCAIVCGPHLHNFAGISQRLRSGSALTIVNDPESLATEVRTLLQDRKLTMMRATAAKRVTTEDADAADRALADMVDAIRPYLPARGAKANVQ